jgi:hypothetical protein
MADITATIQDTSFVFASTNIANPSTVNSVADIADVDLTSLNNGAVLVYKATTNKWTSTTTLTDQNMEGGEF